MEPKKKFPALHLVMFIMTFFTTLVAGAMLSGVNPVQEPGRIGEGFPFSFALMCILLTHELSHYFASKLHRIKATLPFFIPAPTIIGTFGAFIKMKSPIRSREALIDVGASGPIGGFIMALVASVLGLSMSELIKLKDVPEGFYLGSSLLFSMISRLTIGVIPEGYDVLLHPVAFAGWVGFLVTSLNLIPVGQLDGGHIAFAVMGPRHRNFSFVLIFLLITMGVVLWPGWLLWAFLLIILGVDHPPIINEHILLDRKRKYIAILCFLIFILTFTPVPFSMSF